MLEKILIPGSNINKLGATVKKNAVNFAIFSQNATKVELCFFDRQHRETQRINLPQATNHIWHGLVQNALVGEFYSYRIYGPWDPENGDRFNHHKPVLDPYAKKISHIPQLDDRLYAWSKDQNDLIFDEQDSAAICPKGVITNPDNRQLSLEPKVPWEKTVIYELHPKGFSQLNAALPLSSRGKLSGLKHPQVIAYLRNLGVTTIKIMPLQAFMTEEHLISCGLTNYWGYNPLNFFCVHPHYGEGDARKEFSSMVHSLHQHGFEVIVDLVFNHSAESNHLGPNLSFRGIDNRAYYVLDQQEPRFYADYAGCGNVLKAYHPQVAALILDALEAWSDLGIDGIRFDLAALLAIDKRHCFDQQHPIFYMIAQSEKLRGLKLIAEPWAMNSYELGNFPQGWSELNDQFRNTVKLAVSKKLSSPKPLAHVLAGTADLFSLLAAENHRAINYFANHDGLTLRDLASYNHKHNEANCQNNRDGTNYDFGYNHGVEGETDDQQLLKNRAAYMRNLIALLFIAQGVPLLQAGDELGHTRGGNNNAYCQDNKLSWLNWEKSNFYHQLQPFMVKMINWRKENADFFKLAEKDGVLREIFWFEHNGAVMSNKTWDQQTRLSLGLMYFLAADNRAIYSLINLTNEKIAYQLPQTPQMFNWKLALTTVDQPALDNHQAANSIMIFTSAP